ncbi:MAG: hypothetical protein DRJ05_11460, partial [Bacteroidetes bacterium]
GTTTPDNDLTIYSDSSYNGLTLQTADNNFSQGIRFQNSGGYYTWNVYRKDAGYGNGAAHLVFANGLDNDLSYLTDRVFFSESGNVGIGTFPDDDLHIKRNSSVSVLLEADADNDDETDHPSIVFSQDGNLVKTKMGYFGGGNTFQIIEEGASDDIICFRSGLTETMKVASNNISFKPGANDLGLINKIEVTDYTHIDTIGKGSAYKKGHPAPFSIINL